MILTVINIIRRKTKEVNMYVYTLDTLFFFEYYMYVGMYLPNIF